MPAEDHECMPYLFKKKSELQEKIDEMESETNELREISKAMGIQVEEPEKSAFEEDK